VNMLKLIYRVSGFVTPALALISLGACIASLVEHGIAAAFNQGDFVFYWALLMFMLNSMRMDALSYRMDLADKAASSEDEDTAAVFNLSIHLGGEDKRDAD